MLSLKSQSIKPLLESVSGIHLTAYIKNQGTLAALKEQIELTLDTADEYLVPALNVKEIEKLLAPIKMFLRDEKRLKAFTGNIGFFRTPQSFRVLNLPVAVETSCFVADTFHVKPLMKWMQVDREFLLLGFESGSATLYHGGLHSLRELDSIILPEAFRETVALTDIMSFSQSGARLQKFNHTLGWINDWIRGLTTETQPRLFVAGKFEITLPFLRASNYTNAAPAPVCNSFRTKDVEMICNEIRSALKTEARKSFERNLVEFHYAADSNLARGNVFTIARAAVEGRVRKLLISDAVQIFGKLNRKTGELAIHLKDLDHEDDDILDDLAQTVLSHGGEVIVASKGQIPRGRPVLAILDESNSHEQRVAHTLERKAI